MSIIAKSPYDGIGICMHLGSGKKAAPGLRGNPRYSRKGVDQEKATLGSISKFNTASWIRANRGMGGSKGWR
jgi:hypothetical protein